MTQRPSTQPAVESRGRSWFSLWRGRLARPLGYALLGYALFQWFGRSDSGPKEGSTAADFSLELVNAGASASSPVTTRATLEQLQGGPAVLEVFASWCSACRSMAPHMADLARAARKRPVRFLGVAMETPIEEARELHRTWGIPFEVAIADAKFLADYRVTVLPTIIVLDEHGQVRHVTTGKTRSSTIDRWLADLGAERTR